MNKVLIVVLIFFGGVVAALLVLSYFAYVIDSGPPDEIVVNALEGPSQVLFAEQGTATVTATNLDDAMAGLGYAQVASRTWPLLLYRAAATGRFAALAGPAGVAVDEMVYRLGIGESAEAAYTGLDTRERRLLDAFASGINAGLTEAPITRDPSLVLSGHLPEPWLPWHTLAVERLFGWLAVRTRSVEDFPDPIRTALGLHDFGESTIVSSEWPSEPGLFVRYVWGSSALPVLFETSVDGAGSEPVRGACLIGTPFFVAARNGDRAWSFLLDQDAVVHTVLTDSVELQRQSE
ncbi:MAG: penicillin acylase family protein, partial [Rhodothermales bacterium]|nr:penicillin acylase family protein [Rhodothermales bacterium]